MPSDSPKNAFLRHKEKMNKFQIEIITVVCLGKRLEAGGTALEGQAYEFITGYDTLVSMGEQLKACMYSQELGMELAVVVKANGGTNDMSIWGGLFRQGSGCCRNFDGTHHCERGNGLHQRRVVGSARSSACR